MKVPVRVYNHVGGMFNLLLPARSPIIDSFVLRQSPEQDHSMISRIQLYIIEMRPQSWEMT